MVKIKFAKEWAQVFKKFGLESFDDFLNYSAGKVINKNKKREVVYMPLGKGPECKEFFIKRFFRPHFKDMLFTLRRFGRPCSQAECEWENANTLLRNGIDTYKPACYGSQMVYGLEKKSFFVTEKINGLCLTDFVAKNWSRLDRHQKENILTELAYTIRKVHSAEISLPDLYIWHFFIAESNGQYNFTVIDLHRMRTNTASRRRRIRNLGAFDFSLSDKYFDDRLRTTFFNAYMGDNPDGQKEAFLREIKKRSRQLAHRRRRPDY